MENKKRGGQRRTLVQAGLSFMNTPTPPSLALSRRGASKILEGDGFDAEMRTTTAGTMTRSISQTTAGRDNIKNENIHDGNVANSKVQDLTMDDIMDEIEDVSSDVEESRPKNKNQSTLSRVLTRDDSEFVPEQLDEDPVPSMSEDSSGEHDPARIRGRKKRTSTKRSKNSASSTDVSELDKKSRRSTKKTKNSQPQFNTLFKLWKPPGTLIDESPLDTNSDSTTSGSSSTSLLCPESLYEPTTSPAAAHASPGIVKLKLPPPFLQGLQLSPRPALSPKALHDRESPQVPSPKKKKARKKAFTLISDSEDDRPELVSKRRPAQREEKPTVVQILKDDSISPPTPPKSTDSGDDDDDSARHISLPIVDQGKAICISDETNSGFSTATSDSAKREQQKKPLHPFFLKKRQDPPKPVDAAAELSATDADSSDGKTIPPYSNHVRRVVLQTNGVKKPIHPFFMGSKSRTSAASLVDDSSAQSDYSGYDTDAVNSSVKECRTSLTNSFGKPIGTPPTDTWMPSNAIPPAWPSRANRHVIYQDPTVEELSNARKHKSYLHSRRRKLKMTEVHIPKSEDVVEKVLRGLSLNERSAGSDNVLPFPTRHLLTSGDLQALALQHVDLTRHPYLEYLYRECLPHQSAFDRADFEDQMWSAKYTPGRSIHSAVSNDSALLVRKWLAARMHEAMDRSKTLRIASMKSMQRRQKFDDLDGFICSDEDEQPKIELDPISSSDDDYDISTDLLTRNGDRGSSTEDDEEMVDSHCHVARRSKRLQTSTKPKRLSRLRPKTARPSRHSNVLVLTGASSTFKTASVYAAAAELGYFVFEIHAGQKRSGKDILDQVGEMSQSHLVHHKSIAAGNWDTPVFKQKSLVLVEDVDTLYEEDKAFWPCLVKFIETSKRPVILTCTDKALVPADLLEANPGSLLEFAPCSLDIATDMLWMISLCEGHLLPKPDVKELLQFKHGDIRAALAQLQFWCQMAVGDTRKGLSWVLIRPRDASYEDFRKTRVISENTFTRGLLQHSTDWGMPVMAVPGNEEDVAMTDASCIASLAVNLRILEAAYDLLSSADLWRSNMHTLFEVPLVS
ncbi:hypothetical protein V1517DRAFT_185369 [Lipomyces orientalis]|uniref:Uncharacterized protein n=1 Tax=Lipomyces orientalis TaxID=1233043 RepID=A0ACC3TJI4_9ASCO